MKVWHKILVAPGVAIAFLLALGAATYVALSRQNATVSDMFEDRFGSYRVAAGALDQIGDVHADVYRMIGVIGSLDDQKIQTNTLELLGRIDSVTGELKTFADRPDLEDGERKLIQSAGDKLAKYRHSVDLAIDLSAGDVNTGFAAMETADLAFQDIAKDLRTLVDLENQLAEIGYRTARTMFRQVTLVLLAIVALALLASIAVALAMSRRIVRPLEAAIAVARRIAAGDLSAEVAVRGSDETAALAQALKDMNESLRRIVAGVLSGTDQVATTSREIAQSSGEMSSRTEEQASALEETSSSMEQMSSIVGQNADHARQASDLAAQASGMAARGGDVVREAVQSMQAITESSKKITEIIGVIDGIAFQTNILALNAAVEAARAGEQGRGFAVVASEVRTLAHRSAAAAKDIKDLITASAARVDAGARQVNDAGRTMEDLVAASQKVSRLVAEISSASREQAQGIEQVSESISQMEKVTQHNAAMVEEASAAANSLAEQSRALASAVAAFRLREHPAMLPEAADASAAPQPRLRGTVAKLALAR